MKQSLLAAIATSSLLLTFSMQTVHGEGESSLSINSAALEALGIPLDESPGFQPDHLSVVDNPAQNTRVVIGEDERTPVLMRAYPYSAIGRLEWRDAKGEMQGWCTGTLIGPDVVLTNSHCLLDAETEEVITEEDYGKRRDRLVFQANLIQGEGQATAQVVTYDYGWKEDQNPAHDWAVLRLDQPLGEEAGYLPWLDLDLTNRGILNILAGKVRVAGYSYDFPAADRPEFGKPGETAGLSFDCTILDAPGEGNLAGVLFHQCDTNAGASGSALFVQTDDGTYHIVGLHAGANELVEEMTLPTGETASMVNRGVQVNRWRAAALKMLAAD
ncbi:trypsin-like peptidase domain-containing protein [Spirulina major CS-329]|uniref:trypsin-like serine peptidase n=1 Tax=Spirulina TaxID=1154 RepID=UPI00232BEEE8|nr:MULTISPECIES: trypsin-like peptidase domain-containing protein [Spirulina]MDB9496818.1 trypsin-like peptidase domain-containing protein [Spirulina subsalsa CS-330]MDB9504981.1 trypsin-like peptidase domain-containing protein [Spirulina major CS-329]